MFHGAALSTSKVDSAFFFIVAAAAVLFVLVMGAMALFVVRYRRSRHPNAEKLKDRPALEIIWTAIPTVLVLLMFYFGWVNFKFIRNAPPDSMVVDVVARQWSWLFHYANGKEDNILRVPQGKPVKLILTSKDVIHCFFVPAFRIKEDCVPGLKSHLWFNVVETGSYEVFCSEYCGEGHSHMRSQVVSLPAPEFDRWYQSKAEGAAAVNEAVVKNKGCLGCHSTDGSRMIGPTFKGLFGKSEMVVRAGKKRTVIVDEHFLEDYVRDPNVDQIPGFPPLMPKTEMSEAELKAVVEFIKGLK